MDKASRTGSQVISKSDKEGVQQAMGNTGALAGEQRGQPVTETKEADGPKKFITINMRVR